MSYYPYLKGSPGFYRSMFLWKCQWNWAVDFARKYVSIFTLYFLWSNIGFRLHLYL